MDAPPDGRVRGGYSVGLRGAETIMYLPHAHIDLLSVQVGTDIGTLSRLIRCEFVSKFDHALQVSMDAFLYQFITDLVRRIKEASSSAYLEEDEFEPFSPAARPTSVGAHAVGSALPAGAGGVARRTRLACKARRCGVRAVLRGDTCDRVDARGDHHLHGDAT